MAFPIFGLAPYSRVSASDQAFPPQSPAAARMDIATATPPSPAQRDGIAGSALSDFAQTTIPAVSDEPLIVEVNLNGANKGEYALIRRTNSDFLIADADLENLGVQPPFGQPVKVDGNEYFSLQAMGATEMTFDEARVRLHIVLPPERLPQQTVDLRSGRPLRAIQPRDNSAFFNYRILNSGDDMGAQSWSLNTELGIRFNDLFLHSESAHVRSDHEHEDIRYGTSITYDNRDTLQRLVAGDFIASSGELGRVLSLGGISFSKSYQIDPYFVRQPMAGLTSAIHSPSEVEIYLDGMPVRRDTVAPGEFELKNLNYYGGQHDVEVVVRDIFGREQHILYPFYFSDQNLAAGLHDYSYNLGALRPWPGTENDQYKNLAFSAFHRYGVSDALTLGIRGEAEAGRYNVGPTAVLRLNRWGVFFGGFSLGDGSEGAGRAGSAGYTFQSRKFFLQGAIRHFSPEYETVGRQPTDNRPREELTAGAGLTLSKIGNLSIGYHKLAQYQGTNQESVSLGFSRYLGGGLHLMGTLNRVVTPDLATNVFIALSYNLGGNVTSHVFHEQYDDTTGNTVQIGNTMPIGEGLGYRVLANRTESPAGQSDGIAPEVQYNGRYGIYAARVQAGTFVDGTYRTAYQWSVGGGISYVADSIAFSRPVTDSFGMVEIGGLPDVRVYQNGQEIGRTDEQGRLFLPTLGSYRVNRVSIDDRDIPIDYTLSRKEIDISPPLRSGTLVRFDVARIQSVIGRLRVKVGGEWRDVEYGELTVDFGGKSVTVPVGRNGEFYLENLKPMQYSAHFDYRGQRCDFDLTINEPADLLIDVGVLDVCEISP